MAIAKPPKPVKLICGAISASPELFRSAAEQLRSRYGCADIVTDAIPFDLTDYYNAEMGSPLYRWFIAMKKLADPGILADVKSFTNAMEDNFTREQDSNNAVERPINLDPGYITEAKLVLASMKDFAHRVYLREGVYAEVTLTFRSKHWMPLEWTFPDFASGRYDEFLSRTRLTLREQLRKETR